jgi:hypothetical protein
MADAVNLLGATVARSSGPGMSSAAKTGLVVIGAFLLVAVMIVAIVVPLKAPRINPYTIGTTTTTASPTKSPTPAPTTAPAPGPLAITCPPPATVRTGANFDSPPLTAASTGSSGCPPVSLDYVDTFDDESYMLRINDSATLPAAGTRPDACADASVTHVVVVQNTPTAGAMVFIYNASNLTQLLHSFSMNSLAPSGPCALAALGSAQVQYDHGGSKWILLQPAGSNNLCMFASSTGNPVTSLWRLWQFTLPQPPTAPKLAMFGGLYVITATEPTVPPPGPGGSPVSAAAYFIERLPIVNMELTTRWFRTIIDLGPFPGPVLVTPVDNDAGPSPAYATSLNGVYFMRHRDDELYSNASNPLVDYLDLYHYQNINFNTMTPFIYNYTTYAVPEFNMTFCSACVPQPSPGLPLQTNEEPIMQRLVYRQIESGGGMSSSQSIVGSFVVGPLPFRVYWFEMRTVAFGATWYVYQTGIGPTGGGLNRWTPAITMDGDGTIVSIYSTSSSATGAFPSVAAFWRTATTATGGFIGERADVFAGTASLAPPNTDWGSYVSMSAIPGVNGRFIGVGQYSSGAWRTSLTLFVLDPLQVSRQWHASDSCMANAYCTQAITSVPN